MNKSVLKSIIYSAFIIFTFSCQQTIDSDDYQQRTNLSESRGIIIEDWEISQYNPSGIEIIKYHGNNGDLIIPSQIGGKKVIRIGDDAFKGSSIYKIVIPDTIYSIGEGAFESCEFLAEITIPYQVDYIRKRTFYNCYSLKSITFKGHIYDIGVSAFENCIELESFNNDIEIPTNVYISDFYGIGDFAFKNCHKLSDFEVKNRLRFIGEEAFKNSSLEKIILPQSLKTIEHSAFMNCQDLEGITLPENITALSSNIFDNCVRLKSIVVKGNISFIGPKAFNNCIILDVNSFLSNTVFTDAELYGNAFQGTGITDLTIPVGITSLGTKYLNSNMNKLTTLTKINLPEGLTIPSEYFSCHPSLEEIILPQDLLVVPNRAFDGCSKLNKVTIPNSVTKIGYLAFSGTAIESIIIPINVADIGLNAFSTTKKLRNVTILSEKLLKIPSSCFRLSSLEKIKIPNSIEVIDNDAFYGCEKLSMIEVSNPNDLDSIKLKIIGQNAFAYCSNLRNLFIPPSVNRIEQSAFYNAGLYELILLNSGDLERYDKNALDSLLEITTIKVPQNSLDTYKSKYPDYEDIITGL